MQPNPLSLGNKITILPIVHGSADCARTVRRWMLENEIDCIAIPLPPSFGSVVEEGITWLPTPTIAIQDAQVTRESTSDWEVDRLDEEELEYLSPLSYVPIDPCQSVIAAIRVAMGEHLPIEYIDLETKQFVPISAVMPDPYALKKVSLDRFAAAVLPSICRPTDEQSIARFQHMGARLRELEEQFNHILFVCSLPEWPWIREAYMEPTDSVSEPELGSVPNLYAVDPKSLLFLMGEMPFITGIYELARAELDDDENLSVDGIKQMLLTARTKYLEEFGKRARRITPLLLSQCLKYVRNMSLLDRRMTPDLYTLATASQQILGDQFTIHLVETARQYPYELITGMEMVQLGIEQVRLPGGDTVPTVSRLPGPPTSWRSLDLRRRPDRIERKNWQMQWNPMQQCSWPPEDKLVESFRTRVLDRARAIMGSDLARSEKFSSSIKDGIDIRETLRHWYDGEIYVKIMPPNLGTMDACVMMFDSPADPRDYPWRATWFAEHSEESTLAFFASNFKSEMLGPGIAVANYGASLFLFPPRPIEDIWEDPRLDFTSTLEERILAAACMHSQSRQVALLSWLPPGAGWRKLAKHFQKTLIHVPMGQFNDAMIQQLRMFHVLNGRQVRSYAADFIRRA